MGRERTTSKSPRSGGRSRAASPGAIREEDIVMDAERVGRGPLASQLEAEAEMEAEPKARPRAHLADHSHGHAPAMTFEIGDHPVEEDASVFAKELHIFGPSNLDRAVFCRQLATLIEVGIPLLRALKMLAKRTAHGRLAGAIRDVALKVEEGQSVAQAMQTHEREFSPLVCNMVRVGESGGILEASLVRLAQIMESRAEMNRKIISALMYPLVSLFVAAGVIGVIMIKAVPVFTSVYAEAEQSLPAITGIIIGLSDTLTGYWALILILLAAAAAGLSWWGRTPGGRRAASWVSLYAPVTSRISRKIAVARFTRTLNGLLSAGVPLVEALTITADTNENVLVTEALRRVHASVQRGEKMTRPLTQERIFPPLVTDMISIGEETGTLDVMLGKIADIYDADVDANLRGLSSIIEPVMIVLLGGVVIVIALAVMLPYFQLVQIV